MADVEPLQEALARVAQAAFALSLCDVSQDPELRVALARLDEVHALLTAAAYAQGPRSPASVPSR